MANKKQLIAISAPVTIEAGAAEGDKTGPAKFNTTFYTGGALEIAGWDLPVVVDLAGLKNGKVLVANQYHDATKPVGNFTVDNDGKQLVAHGTATAATAAAAEVVNSGINGYQWQASLEVSPSKVDDIPKGKKVQVNGQEFTGPMYVASKGTLKGFAFVSHGADDDTTVSIAAKAASKKEHEMKAEVQTWAESMGIDVENATPDQCAVIEANYEGREGKKPPIKAASNPFEARKLEALRRNEIREISDRFVERRKYDLDFIEGVEKMHDHAIESGMTPQDYRNEMYEDSFNVTQPVIHRGRADEAMSSQVIEAAICQAGGLPEKDKKGRDHFDARTMQLAHDRFKGRIGLKQIFLMAAEVKGHKETTYDVTREVLEAAFQRTDPRRQIHATGFSAIDITTILSATANKFLMQGWNAVDQTLFKIAPIQNVRDFKTNTFVSLADSLRYEQLAPDGQIVHGTLSEITYTNKADTYAKMLSITRTDMINDDLGALTVVPAKLGRGAIKLLNHIFWTEFLALVGASFFASGNTNINTGVADMSVGGLDATETVFMNQTNPDGTPLALMPAIILVPTALKNKAITLMSSEQAVYATSYATAPGNANPFRGRFAVESSPYISNTSYSGSTSSAWWMLANPNELAVIAIAALNGRVEPNVDTAEADFNTLGVQMRGYCDVGVKRQEYRAGVHADGTT